MSGTYITPDEKNPARIVQSIRDLYAGRNNCYGEVTLRTSPNTTTVVDSPNSNEQSIPLLVPLNAAAATEVGAGSIYISSREPGTFTITHSSSAGSRRFGFVTLG